MKMIEMYLLASEYCTKVSFFTKRKAIKSPRTKRYFTQNRP